MVLWGCAFFVCFCFNLSSFVSKPEEKQQKLEQLRVTKVTNQMYSEKINGFCNYFCSLFWPLLLIQWCTCTTVACTGKSNMSPASLTYFSAIYQFLYGGLKKPQQTKQTKKTHKLFQESQYIHTFFFFKLFE